MALSLLSMSSHHCQFLAQEDKRSAWMALHFTFHTPNMYYILTDGMNVSVPPEIIDRMPSEHPGGRIAWWIIAREDLQSTSVLHCHNKRIHCIRIQLHAHVEGKHLWLLFLHCATQQRPERRPWAHECMLHVA
jgi:hypothetical protein